MVKPLHLGAAKRTRARGGVRSYTLMLLPNAAKAEFARYAIWWAQRWCLDYTRALYDAAPNAALSTAGKGLLANMSQKTARDILRAGRAASKATGEPFGCPTTAPRYATASIKPGRGTSYEWWATIPTLPAMPMQAHRAFSRALRDGGKVTSQCQVRFGRNGGLVARVCVRMPVVKPTPSRDYLGCDVGVSHSVTTSDGRTGRSLHPILKRHRERNAERHRQGHATRGGRSALKQLLDREARRVVMLAKRSGKTLAIESLATLANLKLRGSIGAWARTHFGERARQIAEYNGVGIVQVNPAYTSQACLKCNYVDRNNRKGVEFLCLQCGAAAHADIVGARNIARKARGVFPWMERQKGRVKNPIAIQSALPEMAGVLS